MATGEMLPFPSVRVFAGLTSMDERVRGLPVSGNRTCSQCRRITKFRIQTRRWLDAHVYEMLMHVGIDPSQFLNFASRLTQYSS